MMIGFRIVFYLQLIVLVFAVTEPKANTTVEGNTTISSIQPKANTTVEANTTISSIEESTKQEKKRNETFNCENLDPSFMIEIQCEHFHQIKEFYGLILSDRWVLSKAHILFGCWSEKSKCRIGNAADQVRCKDVIFSEKFDPNTLLTYNLGLVLTKDPLRRWSGVFPWPEVRGFTDECTELSIYGGKYPNPKCLTFKAVKLEECIAAKALHRQSAKTEGFLCAKSQHLLSESDSEMYSFRPGLAVCNNVVVGISHQAYSPKEYLAITKIEAYYSFIHEKTNLPVPFESSPNEIEVTTMEPQPTRLRKSSTKRYGPKATEQPTRTSIQLSGKKTTEQQWQQRKVSNAPQQSQASRATSFKESRFLLFLSIIVPILVKFLCQ